MLKDSNFSLNKESFWLFVVRDALCEGSAMFWVVPLALWVEPLALWVEPLVALVLGNSAGALGISLFYLLFYPE